MFTLALEQVRGASAVVAVPHSKHSQVLCLRSHFHKFSWHKNLFKMAMFWSQWSWWSWIPKFRFIKTILFPYEKPSTTAITGPHFRNASLKSNPKSKILKSLYSTSAVFLYYNPKQNKTKYKNQSAESCSTRQRNRSVYFVRLLLLTPTVVPYFLKK